MLFCNWLSRIGHLGLCASFCLYLDSERVVGQYPYFPVDYLEPDSSVDSSVFFSVGRLDHIEIPASPSNYARTRDVPAPYLGQSVIGDGDGLS